MSPLGGRQAILTRTHWTQPGQERGSISAEQPALRGGRARAAAPRFVLRSARRRGGGSSARPRGHPAASGSLRAQWAHADVGSGPRRDLGWIWVQAYRLSAVVGLTQARIHRRDLRARRPASGRLQISDPRIGRGSWAHSNACADPIGLVQGSTHRCAAIRGDRPSVEEEVLPRASLEGAGWAFAKADTEGLAQSVTSRIAARDFDRSASSGDP